MVMKNFADRLVAAIRNKGTALVAGLDPRVDQMPKFVWENAGGSSEERVRAAIRKFHELTIEAIAPLVPAVKPQIAFFEQHGISGLLAFRDTIEIARKHGLLVIV